MCVLTQSGRLLVCACLLNRGANWYVRANSIGALIGMCVLTHLTTDSLPAALSIICHGNVESNIAFLKTLVDNVKDSKLAVV